MNLSLLGLGVLWLLVLGYLDDDDDGGYKGAMVRRVACEGATVVVVVIVLCCFTIYHDGFGRRGKREQFKQQGSEERTIVARPRGRCVSYVFKYVATLHHS